MPAAGTVVNTDGADGKPVRAVNEGVGGVGSTVTVKAFTVDEQGTAERHTKL